MFHWQYGFGVSKPMKCIWSAWTSEAHGKSKPHTVGRVENNPWSRWKSKQNFSGFAGVCSKQGGFVVALGLIPSCTWPLSTPRTFLTLVFTSPALGREHWLGCQEPSPAGRFPLLSCYVSSPRKWEVWSKSSNQKYFSGASKLWCLWVLPGGTWNALLHLSVSSFNVGIQLALIPSRKPCLIMNSTQS